jgi:TerC family integral membrane protein
VSTNNKHRRSGQRLSLLKESRKDEAPLKAPGIFEPGGGPAVIFDEDVPTDVYAKAITRTLQWVAATAGFGLLIFATQGSTSAEEFFAGYLVEQSLSVDNLFVFLLLFDYFKVPLGAQDRVLNWGIYGAIVMRAIMIGLGAAAIHEFHAVLLVFASILIYSAIKILIPGNDEDEDNMEENSIVKFSRKLVDSTDDFDGDRFFTLVEGVKKATPLFICMIAVEISDVVFAVDSVPAVFGVTEVSFNDDHCIKLCVIHSS